ncbi:MAG: hypothetical protein ACJ8F7_01790 [Gemmataceae bacterium]
MHPDLSPDALEGRLRSLPPPPMPDGLKARLLAHVPATAPASRRRWPVWTGLAVAVATACLLAVLAWPRHHRPTLVPPAPETIHEGSSQAYPDVARLPAFSWPLEESSPVRVSTALPADLFD